jgi:hypothetical protein
MTKHLLSAVALLAVCLTLSGAACAETSTGEKLATNNDKPYSGCWPYGQRCQVTPSLVTQAATDDGKPYSGCWPYGQRCK